MSRTHATLTSLFTAIANAIRAKTGSASQIVADDFPEKIADISTGTDVSDTTAIASDVLYGKDFYIANGTKTTGTIQTQTKSATPTESTQTITPDAGNLLSAVNVAAIPSTYTKFYYGTVTTSVSQQFHCASSTEQTTVTMKCASISNLGFTPRVIMCVSQDQTLLRSVYDDRLNTYVVHFESTNYFAIPTSEITMTSASVIFPCGRNNGTFYFAILG